MTKNHQQQAFERPLWICCQLGAREHYAVARALRKTGVLERLITDAWVPPNNLVSAIVPEIRGRFHSELELANVNARNSATLWRELYYKTMGFTGWDNVIQRNAWFQRMAIRILSQASNDGKPRTLFAYSYAAKDLFKFARARGWRTVLGQIDPGPVEERIVAELFSRYRGQYGPCYLAPETYWQAWREECALADRIVVNSTWSESALQQEGVASEKVRVVPLAYECTSESKRFKRIYPAIFTDDRKLRVLFLGQINLRKGLGPLLDAAQHLRDEPVEFWFVGQVQLSIKEEIRKSAKIRWLGRVPRAETDQFYKNADAFIFPTFSDGFGLTQLEAQSWQLPIIASRHCGAVVQDGYDGRILPEVTVGAIVQILREFLVDPSILQRFATNISVGEQFRLQTIGSRLVRVLD